MDKDVRLLKLPIDEHWVYDRCRNLSNIDKGGRKIAAHQNTAFDSITFINTFPVDMRIKFGRTR